MTDERMAQARAEAKTLTDGWTDRDSLQWAGGFERGVVWADANPKPRTITRAEFEARFMPDVTVAMIVLGLLHELGIEVEDDA